MDNIVDKLDESIKLYITQLTRGSLDEREGRRAMEIISFSINLEHVGDIVDKNLAELAGKKIKRRLQFSGEGARELAAYHERIIKNFRIALSVFMSGDAQEARRLNDEKAELRNTEIAAAERHLERLSAGRPDGARVTATQQVDTQRALVLQDQAVVKSDIANVETNDEDRRCRRIGLADGRQGRHVGWQIRGGRIDSGLNVLCRLVNSARQVELDGDCRRSQGTYRRNLRDSRNGAKAALERRRHAGCHSFGVGTRAAC
jgi:hypothetical protein